MTKATNNRAVGAPIGYQGLREYFPTASARARALGVKRDTIRVWDANQASRLRAASHGRVVLILSACSAVSRNMRNTQDVGRWMLSPQPSLRGESPVEALRSLGDDVVQELRVVIDRLTGSGGSRDPLDGDDWAILESELDPVVARQIRSVYEQVVRGAIPTDLDIYELV